MSDDHTSPTFPSATIAHWPGIIQAIQSPLGLFALLILAVYAMLLAVFFTGNLPDFYKGVMGISLVVLLFVIVFVVGIIAVKRPESLLPLQTPTRTSSTESADPDVSMDPSAESDGDVQGIVDEKGAEVLFAKDEERPTLGYWFRKLRPYLHQAVHYSVPTYYLDAKLNVVDWNIAFEVVFADMIGDIRGRHVNWFIARLANHDQVFDHARKFTQDVIEKGAFPYVDMEPIDYKSAEYGLVRMMKVAVQLTDSQGEEKGWVVALIPKQVRWKAFEEKLFKRIHLDKRWSVYSISYDRVLSEFPPYRQLIEDVVSVVPRGNRSVADLGCGTGNVTKALLDNGHRVTAIDDNLGMLDRFISKHFDLERTQLIKSSIEHMEFVPADTFDAVVMVNVLYALDDPLACLRNIRRILRPGGVLGLSTTHRDTNLDSLLSAIEETLNRIGLRAELANDWDTLYKVNRSLEKTLVRRYTRDEIREMIQLAGFEITKDVPSTYEGAVMIIHAK